MSDMNNAAAQADAANEPQRREQVWVFVEDASGGPDLLEYTVTVSESQYMLGMHYDKGMALAGEAGLNAIRAFDRMDPAGKYITRLAASSASKQQQKIPGAADKPLWQVPLTVDMTLSATIQARAQDSAEAERVAREFAASEGVDLFTLDDGNYRGPSDYYCGDRSAIARVEPQVCRLDEAEAEDDGDGDGESSRHSEHPRQR